MSSLAPRLPVALLWLAGPAARADDFLGRRPVPVAEGRDLAAAAGEFDYCGGGAAQDDLLAQLSCTAYPARARNYASHSWCQAKMMFELAYNPNTQKEALVWQADGADDYWVFHGCDGAGMMNDQSDNSYYFEHFMRADAPGPRYKDCSQYAPGSCQAPWTADACWCQHTESPFVHPGTSRVYKYWAGMWTTCGSQWPDELAGKPWFPQLKRMGLKEPAEYGCVPGQAATSFVIVYPWVCNGPYGGTSWYRYWGSAAAGPDGNWRLGLPFGGSTYGMNCYYDNEPFDLVNRRPGYDPHTQSEFVPPVFEVYKFVKVNSHDDYIQGWLIGRKYASDPHFVDTTGGQGFVLKVKVSGPPY